MNATRITPIQSFAVESSSAGQPRKENSDIRTEIPTRSLRHNAQVARSGMVSAVVYVVLATLLAISTYGLDSLANIPIELGEVELAWDHDIFDIPITTFLQGSTTIQEIKANVLYANASYGTQSLSDIQYDTCGVRDWACAEKVRPNTERVLYLLGTSFSMIPDFEVPGFASSPEKIELKHVNTLSGYNAPAVQFRIPGNDMAIVCTARRVSYRRDGDAETDGVIDSVTFCSKRKYDPKWICENEVTKDTKTYVFRIQQGKVTYLGSTPRGEMYYNPRNTAKLTGSSTQGTGFLSVVIGIDEYNGGILQSGGPWDMTAGYLCQGTLDMDTYLGMRWQGLGIVSMTWESSSLMVTNSVTLWFLTMSLAVVQFTYLRKSSVCVIPVNMAKTIVGPVILGFACYGNYNVQVLTTYLNTVNVTSFNALPYKLCGPVMFSSVIAIMSGTAVQTYFNPYLVSPSYVLTIVSVVNWIIVFVLEAFVFPVNPVMLQRTCGLPTSTNCLHFVATDTNFYLSPIIGVCAVGLGILTVKVIQHRTHNTDLLPSNSVLQLFNSSNVRDLATSGAGGFVVAGPYDTQLVDVGILLNKNLVRISSTAVVRSCIVKYVLVYRLLPPIFQRALSYAVGLTMVIKVKGDRVLSELTYLELKDMNIGETESLPSYYS